MITCYIVDDEEHSIESGIRNIEKMPNLQVVGYNTNPLLALTEIQKSRPDIIFLDVEMPEISGMDLVKLLPHYSAVIFVTGHLHHAQVAFDVDAVDFLCKPHSFERFVKSVRKAEDYLQKHAHKKNGFDLKGLFISSHTKGKIIQIFFSKILYIKAIDHTLYIYTIEGEFTTRMNLKNIEEKLPHTNFIRVHRGFIINIDFLKFYDGTGITMSNGEIIPFGEIYKQVFREKINAITIDKNS